MPDQNDLKQLQQRVERSKQLVQRSEIKVEELEATIRGIQDFQQRLALPSHPSSQGVKDNG
jgi:hypothetical protein